MFVGYLPSQVECQESPSKQRCTQIQRMLIRVYSVVVWMCVNICDKSIRSMMPSEWTSCMNRPSGPSCWRKLSARRRKWWCLLPCRYRAWVCVCVCESEYTVLVNVHVCQCSECLVCVYAGPNLKPTICFPGHWAHHLFIHCLINQAGSSEQENVRTIKLQNVMQLLSWADLDCTLKLLAAPDATCLSSDKKGIQMWDPLNSSGSPLQHVGGTPSISNSLKLRVQRPEDAGLSSPPVVIIEHLGPWHPVTYADHPPKAWHRQINQPK